VTRGGMACVRVVLLVAALCVSPGLGQLEAPAWNSLKFGTLRSASQSAACVLDLRVRERAQQGGMHGTETT
jgi:hypothetical protein